MRGGDLHIRVSLMCAGVIVIVMTGVASLYGQEIQIDGVPVVTTATDQDTTYSAGDGLVLDGNEFSSVLPGQMCTPGAAVVGVDVDGNIVCACFLGTGLTGCPDGCVDLLTDNNNCGACSEVCTGGDSCYRGKCNECELVTQDCVATDEGCYVALGTGETMCAVEVLENPPATQGNLCSYLNGCAIGYGCVLVDSPTSPSGMECARFCDPDDLSGPNGDSRCDADAGTGFVCVRASDFYTSGADESFFVGFCVGPEWFE